MWDFSGETQPTARKDYHCDASEWLSNFDDSDFDAQDLAIINLARSENNKILKGTKYIKVTGKYEGDFCTFRAKPELNAICIKYDIYDD